MSVDSRLRALVAGTAATVAACAGARPAPTPVATTAPPTARTVATVAAASSVAAGTPTPPPAPPPPPEPPPVPDAGSPLATLFDGDPTGGPVHLAEARCGPGCLQYPAGWISTDDSGFVYTWFFAGIGQFGTAEVTRCPLATLDDASLALRLTYAGGENVTWSPEVEGTVGTDHAHARIAEGTGTSHGRKAHFWYAWVDVAHRKDIVIAYVVDGQPAARTDEAMAIVRSVRVEDGKLSR
jgi:hypothetical protein